VSLDTAYMTSALDYWDARYLSLMEVMQRASSAKKRARKFIKSSAPSADAESSAWCSPDGHKGPLAPWVPADSLVASQQSAPSARRSLNLNSTVSTSHRLGASKAPFASLCLCVCVPPFSLPNLSVVFVCLFLSQFVILPACLSVYPSASFVCVCVSRPVPDTENINIHPMHTRTKSLNTITVKGDLLHCQKRPNKYHASSQARLCAFLRGCYWMRLDTVMDYNVWTCLRKFCRPRSASKFAHTGVD
jgi:hypothetical protein